MKLGTSDSYPEHSRARSGHSSTQHTVKQFVDLSLHYYNKFLFYFNFFNYNLTQFK
jgi:hypothetical protein